VKLRNLTTTIALVLAAGAGTMTLMRTGSVAASNAQTGQFHIAKNCASYAGGPGSFCTITSSNLPQIPAGAVVYYDQAAGDPQGMLDSNVVLFVGTGNWATGRCTLDLSTGSGLCTFSDGTGALAGFSARVNVTPFPDFVNYHWDGTYAFNPLPPK